MNKKANRKQPRLTLEICQIYIALLQHACKKGLKGDYNYCMPLDTNYPLVLVEDDTKSFDVAYYFRHGLGREASRGIAY